MATKALETHPLLDRLRDALHRERRQNLRVRILLEELGATVARNRRDLDVQFTRIAQLQAELDLLKKKSSVA
jgi:hypothetical protein